MCPLTPCEAIGKIFPLCECCVTSDLLLGVQDGMENARVLLRGEHDGEKQTSLVTSHGNLQVPVGIGILLPIMIIFMDEEN